MTKYYTRQEIDKARQSPSFEREYNLKYLGLIGNVFHTKDIEEAIEKGKLYNPDTDSINTYTLKSIGLDPGFGSSPFGVVVTQWLDNHIQILYAEEFERPDFDEMVSITLRLVSKYKIKLENACQIYVDGANPEFIRSQTTVR